MCKNNKLLWGTKYTGRNGEGLKVSVNKEGFYCFHKSKKRKSFSNIRHKSLFLAGWRSQLQWTPFITAVCTAPKTGYSYTLPTMLSKYRQWELAVYLLNHTKPHQLALYADEGEYSQVSTPPQGVELPRVLICALLSGTMGVLNVCGRRLKPVYYHVMSWYHPLAMLMYAIFCNGMM